MLRQLFSITRQRGLTNADIEKLIGRSKNTITNWRRGHSSPTMFDIVIFAEALGCEITVKGKTDVQTDT